MQNCYNSGTTGHDVVVTDCLQPYVVNYDGDNVIGDACAENGLAVIIINNDALT